MSEPEYVCPECCFRDVEEEDEICEWCLADREEGEWPDGGEENLSEQYRQGD